MRTPGNRNLGQQGGTVLYEWRVAGKPVSVILNLGIARILRQDDTANLPQIGGILLGRVEAAGTQTVYVEDCEPLVWDAAKGGAPQLKEKQRKLLENSLERWQRAPGRVLSAVGYYRTDHRDRLALDDADIELLDRYFKRPADVCLVVKPGKEGFTGAFFIREDGEFLSREASYLEFPFERPQAYVVRNPPAKAAPWSNIVSGRHVATAVAWVVFVTVGIVMSRELWWKGASSGAPSAAVSSVEASGSTAASPLELRIERTGDDLILKWNRSAPAVQAAQRALVAITDSGVDRRVSLTGEQLRSGHFFYRPLSDDVGLRLEVQTGDNRLIAENVRVVDGLTTVDAPGGPGIRSAPPDPIYSPPPPPGWKAMDRVQTPSFSAAASIPDPRATIPADTREAGPVGEAIGTAPPTAPGVEPKHTASQAPAAPPKGEVPAIPPAKPIQSAAVKPPAAGPEAAQILKGAEVAPAPKPEAAAPEQRPIPAQPKPASPIAVPAKLVRQTPLELPRDLRSEIRQDLEFTVTVHVDKTGKVSATQPATPLSNFHGVNGMAAARLMGLAASAVRFWGYTPATVNGVPVASTTTVTFKIRSGGQ
jgi:hypothetical protein